jgi:hypothetical protein
MSADRREQARKAAFTRWAKTPPAERSRRARASFRARFERQVDPAGLLSPADRAVMVDNAIRAHYADLRMRRARKREEQRR